MAPSRRWRALCVAAAVTLPTVSEGESVAVIAVTDPPEPSAELIALARSLRESLRERGSLVLSETDTTSRLSGIAKSLAELDAAQDAALAALTAGNYSSAADRLRAVVLDLEGADGREGSFPRWSRATLRLAWIEHSLGHKVESRALLERLLRDDPDAYADPLLFSPSFLRSVEEVRKAQQTQPRRSVRLAAPDPDVVLYVQGRRAGVGSAALRLAPGTYRVTAIAKDTRLPPVPLVVGAGDLSVRVDTTVRGTAILSRHGPALFATAAHRDERLAALAPELAVDRVVFVRVEDDGDMRTAVVGAHEAPTRRTADVARLQLGHDGPPQGGVAALAAFVAGGVASPLVQPVVHAAAPETRSEPARPKSAVLHYHRPDGKKNGAGLHTWNAHAPHAGVTWYKPRPPSGEDEFGLFWSIPLDELEGGVVNYIIHYGEWKDQCSQDKSWRIKDSLEAWVVTGDCNVYLSKDAALSSPKARPRR